MKKTVFIGLFVILQTFVFLGCNKESSNSSLFAQSSNDAQRIVGTWSTSGGSVFTFNANGTYTSSGEYDLGNGNYMVINSKLITRSGNSDRAGMRDYFLSADGRILVVSYSTYLVWLIKQ